MIRMRRVDIGGVDGAMGHRLVLEVLDEVDGKETLTDATLSVQNQVELP
jgi:hypothetical protein